MAESRLYVEESTVENRLRRFGSSLDYVAVQIRCNGEWSPALFTPSQIAEAMRRARENPEDIPHRPWLARLAVRLGLL